MNNLLLSFTKFCNITYCIESTKYFDFLVCRNTTSLLVFLIAPNCGSAIQRKIIQLIAMLVVLLQDNKWLHLLKSPEGHILKQKHLCIF